jgi:hypothetical protein
MQRRAGQEVRELDAVPAHQQTALRLERRCEGRRATVGQRRAPALGLDRGQPPSGLRDEVDLLVAFAPVIQLALTPRRGVGQVRATAAACGRW